MENYFPHGSTRIFSDLPQVVTCSGTNFFDTRKMALSEVLLFIERDLRLFLSQFPTFMIEQLDCRLDKKITNHILIGFTATDNAHGIITPGIESILWSYNHQVLKQENGRLVPLSPRFTYQIGINSPGEVIPFSGSCRHV